MDNLWTIRIFFDGDAADPAVYPLKSCSIPRCVGAAGTHAQQKATVSISGPTVSLSLKLVGRKEQTKAEIYEGTAIRFTGLIDTDWDFDAKGRLIESVSLTVMDYSGKLKIGVFGKDVAPENARLVRGPQRWQNYAVCDPASQDTSIVHQILKLAAGFLGITIPVKCDATCTTRLDYFQLEQDPDLKTQLEQLLKEFRLDYIFDADNSIRIISTDSTGEPVATVTDFRNSLRGSGSVYKPKSIKATWRKYERRVGEKIGEGYHKSDSVNSRSVEYGQDVTWSLPDGANLDDLEIVSIENLNPGSTWTETGVTHPRIDGASAKITSYDLEGCHIVMERHGACAKGYIRARITADIVIRYNKTQELYSNPGTTQESLTLLHHHQLSSSDGIEGATEYAMYYEAMKRKASTTYTFSSLSEYAPGAIVTLSESSVTGISAKVRILEQTLDPLTGIYKYKAEGAGDLDLKEAITKAETSEDHPIYGGDFLELSADLDESTGVVTVVAEGDAIDYYGLTPAWNLNGTSVTSTGLSVTFPVRDLALSGNVVTCTATLNGETVTATYDIDQLLSAPTLAIFTGDGSLFPAGLVNATLSAVLMRSGVDVALANESVFRWARTSSDTVADATWNASAKATGKRSIIITDSDLVNGKAVFTVSCTIGTITYTSAGFSVVTVSDGQNGWSNATCQLFKRSASAPSAYDGKQLTYTFATATLTGNTGTWSRTIPSGDDPLYVIYASAFAAADTDIVETTDWTAPAILSENGTVGQSGMSVKTILLYQRSETAPALPTGQVTYNFDSGKISGQGAWSLDVPTTNGSPLWVISATAASRSASDIIEPSEWSTQSIMAKDGEQGPQGEQGAKGDTGEAGPKGETGATGTSIIGIVEEYALSSSSSSVTGSWGTAVPTLSPTDKYLWNRSKTMYSDGTSSAYTTAVVIGVYGDTGKAMTYMYASAPEGLYPGGYPFGTDQNVIGMADTAIGIDYEWHDTVPDIADGYVLWTKTTAPDGTVSIYRVQGPKGEPGETGSSAKDFTLYQSATYFEVSPRGVTHKMQVISITCVPLNLTSPTITWSVSSAVPTQAISSDKTVLSLTVQSGVALSDMTVACAVSGIGTKTIKILATPVGEDGPIYLGTDWDESTTTTSEGDPLKSGDYYLRLSDTMVRVYSGTEWRDVSAATSTHKMMQDALSDVLKHGADVKSTSSVLYAYVGNLVAQSASIKRLSTEVITSANYAETNGSPATGYKLDGPNDKIKTVGMIASEGIFRNVNISGGSMSVFNANNQTVFKTADRTATANVIDISVPSGNSFYSLKRIIDSMATKPATESPDYKKLRTDAATIEGVSFDGIVYQTAGKRRTIILGHDLQCDSRTGALKYSNFAETPTHTIVKGSDGYYGIKECHIDIYGVDTIFCTLGRGGNKWNGKNAYIMLYSSSGVLLKSATSSDAGYIALEYGGVIPVGSYAVAYVDSESYGLYYDWYFESRFPELAPEFGYGILFFNADATSESNYYRLVNTYSNTPFTISKIRGSAVSVSTADYLTALPVADIISMIATTGTYISVDSTSSTYSSTDQTQVSLSELIVTRNMLSLQPINGTNIVLSVGDVVDNPVIHFEVIGEREGIAVSNINAINEYGEIATSGLMFANIWTGKIDNINVCDSDNQVLSTSSQSIVGAINELKSDFGVRYPIFHGSLCPPSTPLLEIGEIPVFTATSLTKYRYFCVSGYMDSGAENMPETHRFVLFDANGNTTKLGRIFLNITLQEQLVITGISYGSSGDANAFLGGLVVQFNAENYLHKMTCSQYGRIIVSGTAIQSMTQYTIKDIWLE